MAGRSAYEYIVEINEKNAESSLNKLSSQADSTFNRLEKNAASFSSGLQRSGDHVSALAGGLSKLAALGGVGFAAQGLFNYGETALKTYEEFEKLDVVLTNTLQSASEADKVFADIRQFAADTPFQVDQMSAAFVKLANQGFKPTIEEMTAMGDLTSAVGKDFDQLSEAVLDAQQFEFERLKEFGIKAKQNGDKISLTFKGQTKEVQKTSKAVREALLDYGRMKGVAGSMAAISSTLSGSNSNLEDSYSNLAYTIGERLAPTMMEFNRFQKHHVDNLAEYIALDPVASMFAETTQVNELATKLYDANIEESERLKILEQLKLIAPDVVAGIDAEALSIEKLKENLEEYNKGRLEKGAIMPLEQDVSRAKRELQEYEALQADAYQDFFKRAGEVAMELPAEKRKDYFQSFQEEESSLGRIEDVYSTLQKSVGKQGLFETLFDNKGIANLFSAKEGVQIFNQKVIEMKANLKAAEDILATSKKELGINDDEKEVEEEPTNEAGGTFAAVSKGISSGGARQTNITVNLDKFQDQLTIQTTVSDGSMDTSDFEDAVNDAFLRVLNSSAELAGR